MTTTGCVFLVDDDPSARHGLERLLRAAGYDVHAFASVKEFPEVVEPDTSGCVLLDVRTGGTPSGELSAELQKRFPRLPIIVVTTDDDPETRLIAEEIDAVGFFRKPVDGSALLDAVAWVLRSGNGV